MIKMTSNQIDNFVIMINDFEQISNFDDDDVMNDMVLKFIFNVLKSFTDEQMESFVEMVENGEFI